ncbi:MAG: hypothetical protein WCD61_07430 [Acinetobacter bohemicus]
MIKQLKPIELPDDLCWWFHPDFNLIDPMHNRDEERGYTLEEWDQLQVNGNVDISIDTSIDLEEIDPDATGDWKGFKPKPPTPEHFLIAAFDSEHLDSAILWWAKPRADLLESTKVNTIDSFIEDGSFDKAFVDVFGLPESVVKSLKEVS